MRISHVVYTLQNNIMLLSVQRIISCRMQDFNFFFFTVTIKLQFSYAFKK